MSVLKLNEVKQEYQLQQWRGMVREQKESGLTVRQWCADQGVTEHAFYYRLRKIRQVACIALEQAQPVQLAEVPLTPAASASSPAQLQIRLAGGTVEISNPDLNMLDCILRVLMHAE